MDADSGGADLAEELGHLVVELLALGFQRLGALPDVLAAAAEASASVLTPLMWLATFLVPRVLPMP